MSKNYLNYACRTAWLLAFAWPTLSFANETEVTGDPFVDIPASTSALKLLDDNGNDCHFAIDDPKSIDALSTQISKLYKVKPVKRGETLAWSIKNKKSSADQASKITVMITIEKDGMVMQKFSSLLIAKSCLARGLCTH